MKKIEFYFDLGSPYSYIGFHRIQDIAKQYQTAIICKPILLGGVFKATGNSSPLTVPAKARYSMVDLKRWSELWNIPVKMNPYFPINTLNLMRLTTAIQLDQPENFLNVVTGLFTAMFCQPENLNDPEVFEQVLQKMGLDTDQIQGWLGDERVKEKLKLATEQAVERGVFGVPTCFVNDEMYWGIDHFHFVETALK
nr:2-hydroxychromene-2-carboxylate isomerase [Acinetobacter sp. Marseille-Q1620]